MQTSCASLSLLLSGLLLTGGDALAQEFAREASNRVRSRPTPTSS